MPTSDVYVCQCPHCPPEADPPAKALHQQRNLFLSRLDEQQRRWHVAWESQRVGGGGDRWLSLVTGLDEKTIRRGRTERVAALSDRPTQRVRQPGGGRKPIEKKTPP